MEALASLLKVIEADLSIKSKGSWPLLKVMEADLSIKSNGSWPSY